MIPEQFPSRAEQFKVLEEQLVTTVASRDLFRLSKQLRELAQSAGKDRNNSKLWKKWTDAVYKSQQLVKKRTQKAPNITFPDLPVSARAEEICDLIKTNQVVIIAGETGSGKTTQLPKICLQAGCGRRGMIGHTQPRRIAARSVASRIAEELCTELGDTVGYQVRFSDQTSADGLIKLMTDGILLAEIQHNRFLSQYDTIIIDEAHERSLNIDFLLGYLKKILPYRRDLKIIVTSATIDVEKFSRHFDNAPVIEVTGRTYPVDIVYREPDELYKVKPGISLHKPFDGSHPSLLGTYLAACVVFASITQQSPLEIDYNYYGKISDSDKVFLQEVAHKTVEDFYSLEL